MCSALCSRSRAETVLIAPKQTQAEEENRQANQWYGTQLEGTPVCRPQNEGFTLASFSFAFSVYLALQSKLIAVGKRQSEVSPLTIKKLITIREIHQKAEMFQQVPQGCFFKQ